jgi:hypothetical protein
MDEGIELNGTGIDPRKQQEAAPAAIHRALETSGIRTLVSDQNRLVNSIESGKLTPADQLKQTQQELNKKEELPIDPIFIKRGL